MSVDLEREAHERRIKYFLVSFVDMFGVLRSKLVPAQSIGGVQKNGAGFAGFASWLDLSPADPDMLAMPDGDSLIQLPWRPEIGWLASDLHINGMPIEASPRVALKKQIGRLKEMDYVLKSGVECEFFLLNRGGKSLFDERDIQEKPCYDQSALMRRYDVISKICDSMIDLGWKPYQNDHEDANGQFELNWSYANCLQTADRHSFFKYMVKAIAEEHDMRASFMPKPFTNLTGNGCHCHVSLWDDKTNKNVFLDIKDDLELSRTAYSFLGGILNSAESMSAIYLPTINSYKRIYASSTTSGATWSPNAVTFSGDNRTHMVRVPGDGRFELRLMDGATNPYLLQAAIILCGLDGIHNKREAGKRSDVNMYTEGHKLDVKRLPTNLLDALRSFGDNKIIRQGFGGNFCDSYIKLKMDEIQRFSLQVSDWELENTLDC